MKKTILFFTLLVSEIMFSQYSSYYNINTNSTVNADINHNINGTITENKTITTIDYGALQLANAQSEKNRLEQQKFEDEKQKQIALEIAEDPLKAYDYGFMIDLCLNDKKAFKKEDAKVLTEQTNFKNFCFAYVVPNTMLFTNLGAGRFQNVSKDGVITEFIVHFPNYNKNNVPVDLEKDLAYDHIKIGEENTDKNKNKLFVHRKDLKRADVFGIRGYKATIIGENKFEKSITDDYFSYNANVGNGYKNRVRVNYYGDKDAVTFEQLEGRRFYMKQLIEKIISTGKIYNEKF